MKCHETKEYNTTGVETTKWVCYCNTTACTYSEGITFNLPIKEKISEIFEGENSGLRKEFNKVCAREESNKILKKEMNKSKCCKAKIKESSEPERLFGVPDFHCTKCGKESEQPKTTHCTKCGADLPDNHPLRK